MTALDAAVDQQAERIGERIRALRRARGYTLVQLATLAGLSHPFLSQLERGRARPSMVSLERIARALGSSQVELLMASADSSEETDATGTSLVRAEEGTRGHFGGGEARVLAHAARRFTPMEYVGFSTEVGDYFSHAEDEFVHVTFGAIEVDLGPEGTSVLRAGDSLYYVGGTPHRWRAIEEGGFRLFLVKEKPEQL